MIRVAHLIHTTGIGGVEAAVDLVVRRADLLLYRVFAFEQAEPSAVSADFAGAGVNSPRSALGMLRRLHVFRPEVVVSSLWRSVIVGGVHRIRRPRTPWVIYVHNTRYTNVVDALVHRVALPFADRILCDSAAALDALVPKSLRSRAEVVCPDSELMYLSRRRALPAASDAGGPPSGIEPAGDDLPDPDSGSDSRQPMRIIYWGRAVEAKRLDRSLELVAALEAAAPGAFALDIISPETPTLRVILAMAHDRGLPLTWLGAGKADHILAHAENASFFLQLSEYEGLAMSVREALALGLVPVVTPVGAIRHYTEDGVNAVHVRNDDAEASSEVSSREQIEAETFTRTARRIIELSHDLSRLTTMSRAARTVPGSDFIADFESALEAASNIRSPRVQRAEQ
ncbi:glycosyltransferase [Brevibacterium sp.]|uniref:glycosyltransferase n=1 Tax=Brevibacterium sp. TaxID=1701 RepID=UPI00264A409F|nr:glycosyltransferase [Brevibacterium sp.]MDN6604385.1 glycosyltransferase [Brevibacterium sp.]